MGEARDQALAALERIARNEREVWDEDLGVTVVVSLDEEEVSEIAREAHAALTTQAEQIARLTARLGEVEGDADDYRDRLHDLVMIDAEEWAIGGGPGFKERRDKAWTRAREPFEP